MDQKLIKMTRSAEEANGGPLEADVHPDEVSNYSLAGFVVAAPPVPAKLNAADTIAVVMKATAEELDLLATGEERKTVLDAIAKRRQELTAPPA